MATERDYQSLFDRVAALREQVANNLSADLVGNPQLADALTKQIDDLLASVVSADGGTPPPPDAGLSALAGVGPSASSDFGETRIPPGVTAYDDTITSERIMAVGDMYYLWQHEKIGVFRVVQKLQELFRAGAVRLSGGTGRFRPLPVRSPAGAALHRIRPDRRLSPVVRLRRRLRRRRARGPTPISIPYSLISSSR